LLMMSIGALALSAFSAMAMLPLLRRRPRFRSKFTQNYPTERADYHVTAEEAVRIESYDLPDAA
ncbi:MAG: hypothetical protein ACXWPM_08725, partial [Bdellovibrionota bacterium]